MSKGLGVSIRRGVAAGVCAALVGAALFGCDDDTDDAYDPGLPSESELTESTPTSTPTDPTTPVVTGPQEPTLPDAAKASGKKGARAFVAYYIKLLNYASHSGDGTPLLRYGPDCRVCKSQASFAATLYRKGGWYRGGAWQPDPRTWLVLPSGSGFFVGVHVDTAAGRQLPKRGAEVTRFDADRFRLNFLISPSASIWRIRSLVMPS